MSSSPLTPANYWEISYATTRILAETSDSNVAAARVLELVGQRLGWQLGGFWVVDELSLVLRCTQFWNPGNPGHVNFEQLSYARVFSLGEGLPGSAWKERRPVWVDDVRVHQNFPRASIAKLDGICTGAAFPLYAGNRILGVLEFFSRELRAPDPTVFDFFTALGGQIGIFLDRAHATDTLKQVEAQFQMAADKSYDVVFTIDDESTILFVNSAVERVFGYTPDELLGQKLMMVMPEYLRAVHEAGLRRYATTGKKHISWDGYRLPGLHKDGGELPLEISFGEFWRGGRRVFTGFVRDCRGEQTKLAAG
jgi:PAS domain S-box-containing protein